MDKAFYFCGQVIPSRLLEKNFDSFGKQVSPAANTFYNALLDGLCENGARVYTSLVLPGVNVSDLEQDYEGKWQISFGKAKSSFISRVMKSFTTSFSGIRSFQRKEKKSEKYVVFNVLRLGASLGGLFACRLFGLKTVGIVTDVPGYRIKEAKGGFFRTLCDKIARKILGSFDCYVLLSEAMAEVMPKKKPYIVFEGLYHADQDKEVERAEKFENFTVMYAGSLHYQYGIMNLVKAVQRLPDEDIRLHIYGSGEAKDEIESISKSDPRIAFFGSVSHGEILKQIRKASLLVNPRPVEDEYVKYSFPSKNMEYMASGTPVLLTDIPSLPEEYKEYIFTAKNNGAETLSEKIAEIKHFSGQNSVTKKATDAREFILAKKSERVQAARLIQFLQ